MPHFDLTVFRAFGHLTGTEGSEVLARYVAHPDYRPGRRLLTDLADVVSYTTDQVTALQIQARLVGLKPTGINELVIAQYAPTYLAMQIAQRVQRAWNGVTFARVIAHPDEAELLDMLGLPSPTIDDLFLTAD